MGWMRAIVKFLSNAKQVSRLDEVEDGRVVATGVVRKGEAGTLASPLKGQPCVAFYYRCFHMVGSRSGQMMVRVLKTEEGFHPFALELEGGSLAVEPRKPSGFTQRDHQALVAAGYQGFRATEDVVTPGTRVRLHGVVRRDEAGDGGRWVLTYKRIELVDPKPVATAPRGPRAGGGKRRREW